MGIYEGLGLRRVINADATLTRLGGSLMSPEVLDAMRQAAGSFVDMHELQQAVGRRLAELTRNEAAYVSTGAAAGIVLATLASMNGGDLQAIARAIETGAFVLAATQGGLHENGRMTFGHSLIVSPWGEVLAEGSYEEEGVRVRKDGSTFWANVVITQRPQGPVMWRRTSSPMASVCPIQASSTKPCSPPRASTTMLGRKRWTSNRPCG